MDEDLRAAAERVSGHIEHELNERAEHRPEKGDDDDDGDDHHLGRAHARSSASAGPPSVDTLARLELGAEPGFIVIVASTSGAAKAVAGGTGTAGLPDDVALAKALTGAEVFSDVLDTSQPLRLFTRPLRQGSSIIGAVQIATPTNAAAQSLTRTLLILAATGGVGLLLSMFGSLFLADRAMRPIELVLERQRRFIADASHELRTPVAVLRARAELLAKDAQAVAPAAREELLQLSKDADQLSDLLVELLDLARLDAEQAPLELVPVPVADVVEEVVHQLQPLANERGVTLSARGASVFARASSLRLGQVLRALGDNALKHTAAGGHVTFETSADGAQACIRVSDDGTGIAREHLDHVKDRFYRVDASRTRPQGLSKGGTGLGLAIAHELVLKMGGELLVESELGRGTLVTVRLALARGAG